jgi:hypothetical protein
MSSSVIAISARLFSSGDIMRLFGGQGLALTSNGMHGSDSMQR